MKILSRNLSQNDVESGQYSQLSSALTSITIDDLFPNLSKYTANYSDYSLIHGLDKVEIQDYFQKIKDIPSQSYTESAIEIFSNENKKSKMISLSGGCANKIIAIIDKNNKALTFVK
jgi:hypothetical protein